MGLNQQEEEMKFQFISEDSGRRTEIARRKNIFEGKRPSSPGKKSVAPPDLDEERPIQPAKWAIEVREETEEIKEEEAPK